MALVAMPRATPRPCPLTLASPFTPVKPSATVPNPSCRDARMGIDSGTEPGFTGLRDTIQNTTGRSKLASVYSMTTERRMGLRAQGPALSRWFTVERRREQSIPPAKPARRCSFQPASRLGAPRTRWRRSSRCVICITSTPNRRRTVHSTTAVSCDLFSALHFSTGTWPCR